jgi:hypothetical protein
MAKQYVCDHCGALYDQMLIDYPNCCSVECVARGEIPPASQQFLGCSAMEARSTPPSTKGNGQAE